VFKGRCLLWTGLLVFGLPGLPTRLIAANHMGYYFSYSSSNY
jgi:hypothetical protein